MSYRENLHRELTGVGITGRLRARILDEIDDHLQCAPEADLGDPQLIARRFADELGTTRARRAALTAFAALALAGLLFAVAFLSSPQPVFAGSPPGVRWTFRLAAAVGAIAPQVAFVAGVLAVLRALHRRTTTIVAAAEARVILRRATVGVTMGLASMVSLVALALELHSYPAGWWVPLTLVCAGVGGLALLATVPALLAARRLPSRAEGPAGDMFDDIGAWLPQGLEGRPWRLALIVAAGIFVLMSAAGWMASDGYDGMLRGLADGLLCLLGFATLGRYLGLWSPAGR